MTENNEDEFLTLSFLPKVAKEMGVASSIIFHNIAFWCQLNESRESALPEKMRKHYHEELYWVYYSRRELSEQFSFLSDSQMRTILANLVSAKYIRKGRFNRKGYDKTSWYTPIVSYPWVPTAVIHHPVVETSHALERFLQPIPDIYNR